MYLWYAHETKFIIGHILYNYDLSVTENNVGIRVIINQTSKENVITNSDYSIETKKDLPGNK